MIKPLTESELEVVSGGFVGMPYSHWLVGEAGPQRLLNNSADEASSPTPSAPLAHIELETESPEELELFSSLREVKGFMTGGLASGRSVSRHQPETRRSHYAPPYRSADRAMARRSRTPATLSWKSNYLSPR